ncbi:MAG: phage holin family protein [Acidimicrobiia bacterium]|nr:phage holin family protein [Acidimicrobiia bacterium]
MRLIIRLAVNAFALWLAATLVSGIDLTDNIPLIVLVALIFGLVNVFIGSVLKLLSLPLTIVTLGLFALVVNTALLAITASLTDNLQIDGFWSAFLGALIISIVSSVLNTIFTD